jgi:hypothetical protein
MGFFDLHSRTSQPDDAVRFGSMTRKDIDLNVIREHLDTIEEALMHGYRLTLRHLGGDEKLLTQGMDALLAVKDAFGGQSEYAPTHEVKSAVLRCERIGEGEEEVE